MSPQTPPQGKVQQDRHGNILPKSTSSCFLGKILKAVFLPFFFFSDELNFTTKLHSLGLKLIWSPPLAKFTPQCHLAALQTDDFKGPNLLQQLALGKKKQVDTWEEVKS